jgi:ABC-type phosphate transport system auxiliary subunit
MDYKVEMDKIVLDALGKIDNLLQRAAVKELDFAAMIQDYEKAKKNLQSTEADLRAKAQLEKDKLSEEIQRYGKMQVEIRNEQLKLVDLQAEYSKKIAEQTKINALSNEALNALELKKSGLESKISQYTKKIEALTAEQNKLDDTGKALASKEAALSLSRIDISKRENALNILKEQLEERELGIKKREKELKIAKLKKAAEDV